MSRFRPTILGLKLSLAAALGLGLVFSCNDGPDIVGTDSNFEGLGKSGKKKEEKGGALFGEDEEGGPLFDDDGSLREEALDGEAAEEGADEEAVKINYPVMDLTGRGGVTCDGDVFGVLGQYTNTIDREKVDLNFYNGVISGAGKGQDKANAKIQSKLGQTIYTRITKEEREEWIDKNYELKPYAIFAKQAVKTKAGHTFIFSNPLPVFPFPAAPARYKELEAGPKTWSAQISGSFNFTVNITVSLISANADAVVLKFDTVIPQDTNRALYELWPMAREATYTMNPKALEVQNIASVNWFNDGDSCGGPETLNITFRLCKKTIGGVTKDFPCQ